MTRNTRFQAILHHGADGRGRTDTVLLPQDFESCTSANSITPANWQLEYNNTLNKKMQVFFWKIKKKLKYFKMLYQNRNLDTAFCLCNLITEGLITVFCLV